MKGSWRRQAASFHCLVEELKDFAELKRFLLKCVLTPFCACVSTSELTLAIGSEVDRASHDGYGGRQPRAVTNAGRCWSHRARFRHELE